MPFRQEETGLQDTTDYKKLYYALFNDVTDVIERLKKVQADAEERFLAEEE